MRPCRSLRRLERGASIFIVMLVTVLLTGLGIFAARAATMTSQASGYARQYTQTAYAGEVPALLMPWMFGGPMQGPNQRLYNQPPNTYATITACNGTIYRSTPANPNAPNRCWAAAENAFNTALSGRQTLAGVAQTRVVELARQGGASSLDANPMKNDAGSLGPWTLDYAVEVSMGEGGPAAIALAGSAESAENGNTVSGPQRSLVMVRSMLRPRISGVAPGVCGGVQDGYGASQVVGYGFLEFNDTTGKGR